MITSSASRSVRIPRALVLIFIFTVRWGFAQAPMPMDAPLSGTRDSSYVVIAAIKSVSGERPENEFFAAHWRARYGKYFFALAGLDIALSNVRTDSVSSPQRELTEAGLSLDWDFSQSFRCDFRKAGLRSMFVGGIAKIFNTEAYYGVTGGSVELSESAFFSSYFYIAYLRRFFLVSEETKFNTDGQRLANDNLYTEFFIHSNKIGFFEFLAIRGGVLMPLLGGKGTFEDIQFRITVAVPVGGVHKF